MNSQSSDFASKEEILLSTNQKRQIDEIIIQFTQRHISVSDFNQKIGDIKSNESWMYQQLDGI
jgi:hypothetical protein